MKKILFFTAINAVLTTANLIVLTIAIITGKNVRKRGLASLRSLEAIWER